MTVTPIFSNSWPRLDGTRVCHLNVNHLRNKLDEISDLLLNHNLDIFGISESRLNDKIDDCELSVPGFNLTRRDSNIISHTGLCVYINSGIIFNRRGDLESLDVESLWIEVFFPINRSLSVLSIETLRIRSFGKIAFLIC